IDCRAVLRADVVALTHALGRVMAFPERFQQCFVTRNLRIIDDEYGFGVAAEATAHFFVGRVRCRAAGIADRGHPDTRHLPEHPLRAPEAAEPEDRLLQNVRIRPDKRMIVDEMPLRYRHWLAPPGQTVLWPGDAQLTTRKWPHLDRLFCANFVKDVGNSPA